MDLIHNSLYHLSNALLLPTLLIMLGLTAWTALLVGGIIREAWARRSLRRLLRQACDLAGVHENHLGKTLPAMERLRSCPAGLPARFIQRLGNGDDDLLECSKALEDTESDATAALARLTWLTRVAPMLGLMGTLIPLGPALTGLASGDMAMLSGNLVVAFTATVIGVLIGCVSFSLALIRRNWYQRDMSDLEYIVARIHKPKKPAPAHEKKEAQVG